MAAACQDVHEFDRQRRLARGRGASEERLYFAELLVQPGLGSSAHGAEFRAAEHGTFPLRRLRTEAAIASA
jgi:hypothetical protein